MLKKKIMKYFPNIRHHKIKYGSLKYFPQLTSHFTSKAIYHYIMPVQRIINERSQLLNNAQWCVAVKGSKERKEEKSEWILMFSWAGTIFIPFNCLGLSPIWPAKCSIFFRIHWNYMLDCVHVVSLRTCSEAPQILLIWSVFLSAFAEYYGRIVGLRGIFVQW